MRLRLTAFKYGILMSATTTGVRILRICVLIILARLLQPADFGLLASAMVAVTGLVIVAKLGLSSALVASKQDKYTAAHQVFVMNFGMGVCLSLLLVFGAGAYSRFFGEPLLQPICQVMALVILFDALRTAPDALLMKDMMFGRHILSTVFGVVAGAAASILLAILDAGVWSLVCGAVTTSIVTLGSLFILCPDMRWLYRQAWENVVAKQLLGFGIRHMTASFISY